MANSETDTIDAGAELGACVEYSVRVKNEGSGAWKFVVYQKPPTEDAEILAWLVSSFRIGEGSEVTFSWNPDYQFVWTSTVVFKPGINIRSAGYMECNSDGNNLTNFTVMDDTPAFSEATAGAEKGTLKIIDGEDVPPNTFSVGVAMSKKGIYVENAGPNLTHSFTPTPSYWVIPTDEVNEGDVLDIKTATQTAELNYPPNVYNLTATLKSDNTWKISSQ